MSQQAGEEDRAQLQVQKEEIFTYKQKIQQFTDMLG